jgi:predicted NBD/HSP70 family sugar kinase
MRLYAVGQRSETVRRANLSAIVRELHASGARSRSDLVARTGLTRSAIRGLIKEFVDAGLASEVRATPLGGPGRPSPLVRPNPESAVVLAVDIAVDSLAVALVGLGGEVIDLVRIQRPRGHSSVAEIVDQLAEQARVILGRSNGEALIGVGVAVAGIVRRSDGFVAMAPNLGWRDVPLGAPLSEALGAAVPISIANEADLGALAELHRGAAVGADNVIYLSGEVGVGGGLIVDGKPLTGVAGFGGEVGHMPVNPGGIACQCGSFGCWETEVGEEALLRLAGHPAGGGWAEVDAVIDEARAGSDAARGAFDTVGRWLGVGLAGLVNVFNPRLVVMGGLFGRIHPFVATALEAELDRRTLPGSRALVRVVPARLGVDAPLLGAAELAFEPLLADPAAWLRPRGARAELASA